MRKLSTVQNGGFPNIFSFHIIHYTLFSSLKNICNKKDFHVVRQTCWWKRPFHVGCQDKSDPGKIHEVILVKLKRKQVFLSCWDGYLFFLLCPGFSCMLNDLVNKLKLVETINSCHLLFSTQVSFIPCARRPIFSWYLKRKAYEQTLKVSSKKIAGVYCSLNKMKY